MICIGEKTFAENKREMEQIRKSGRDVHGLAKRLKRGIRFMDCNGDLFAVCVNNRHNEQFFVSARRQDDGRILYMFAVSNIDREKLGLPESYMEEIELAESLFGT